MGTYGQDQREEHCSTHTVDIQEVNLDARKIFLAYGPCEQFLLDSTGTMFAFGSWLI